MTRCGGLVTRGEIKSLDGHSAFGIRAFCLYYWYLSCFCLSRCCRCCLQFPGFCFPCFSWVLLFVANVALGSLVSASLASAPLLWVPVAFLSLTVPWSSISHASFASSHVSGSEAGTRMQSSHPKFNSRVSFPPPPKHCAREKGYIVCQVPANMGIWH